MPLKTQVAKKKEYLKCLQDHLLQLQQKMPFYLWLYQKRKKLAIVLVTSTLVTDSLKILQYISYIKYSVQFQKSQAEIKTLINSYIKVNIINPVYIIQLGLMTQKTSVRAQIIYGSLLMTYGMVLAKFPL